MKRKIYDRNAIYSSTWNTRRKKNQIASIPNYDIVITSYELLKRDIEEYKNMTSNLST